MLETACKRNTSRQRIAVNRVISIICITYSQNESKLCIVEKNIVGAMSRLYSRVLHLTCLYGEGGN